VTGSPPRVRPSWDETWLAQARAIGARSLCSRAQVGAVIVSSDNSRTWVGYNGVPAGFEHNDRPCVEWCPRAQKFRRFSPSYDDCYTVHAEVNALLKMDRELGRGGTLYTTGDVCFACAKVVANSGLATVVVLSDGLAAHRKPDDTYRFLERCGLSVIVHTGNLSGSGPVVTYNA